jgi:hypothetical protein
MAKKVALILLLYACSWSVSYVALFLLRGGTLSFSYFFEYLALGWSFSGGELPSFMWLLSLLLFTAALVSLRLVKRIHSRGSAHA